MTLSACNRVEREHILANFKKSIRTNVRGVCIVSIHRHLILLYRVFYCAVFIFNGFLAVKRKQE